ncbi:MAG: response regulator transcription factor [Dehalococcoidia bacterium]
MATPAREPFRLVPNPGEPLEGPTEARLVIVAWGAYPAMRAGIRALLAEMDLDAVEDVDPKAAAPIIVADAGDRRLPDLLEELRERFGEGSSVIVLASEATDFDGLQPGPGMPAGLLLRDVSAEELAAAVQAVANGLTVLDPEVATVLTRGPRPSAPAEPLGEPLTEREMDVLRELALGLPNKAIALHLGISEHTVKYHVGEILGKLEAASRTEAVMLAARRGLLPL